MKKWPGFEEKGEFSKKEEIIKHIRIKGGMEWFTVLVIVWPQSDLDHFQLPFSYSTLRQISPYFIFTTLTMVWSKQLCRIFVLGPY